MIQYGTDGNTAPFRSPMVSNTRMEILPQVQSASALELFRIQRSQASNGVAPLENLVQTAEHRRSIRGEMNAFFLLDLVNFLKETSFQLDLE